MSGLYFHIPFCKQACSYCDFYFVTRQDEKQRFVETMVNEIYSKRDTSYTQETVKTIYFGGGTPSLLSPSQFSKILEAVSKVFKLKIEEITLEMNPDDVSKECLEALSLIGITRASMGIQSFNEDLLRFMNRVHSKKEALASLEMLASSGFKNYTVDLIYGNPNQTLNMLERDLEVLLGFDPPHVSAYSLSIEPRTRLGKQFKLGRLIPAKEDEVAAHSGLVSDTLGVARIHQYEVSNFAKSGFEAIHNSNYWKHHNYLGFGPGAHSFWWEETENSAIRWNTKPDLKKYLEKEPFVKHETEKLSYKSLAEEYIMLGLRTRWGINESTLRSKYKYSINQKHREYFSKKEKEGIFCVEGDQIRLTKQGLRISDAIILDMLTL